VIPFRDAAARIFDGDERLKRVSDLGDPLKAMAAIKAAKPADEIWDNPHKAARKDERARAIGASAHANDARWWIKYSKKKDDAPIGQVDIAIPAFGDKSHVMTDRAHGFIRAFKVTDAARETIAQLKDVVRRNVPATGVWADSAHRSKANAAWLAARGLVSNMHRRAPKGRPMPEQVRRGDATKSKVRAFAEHDFADQKHRMGGQGQNHRPCPRQDQDRRRRHRLQHAQADLP
jgi:hypothetical protein